MIVLALQGLEEAQQWYFLDFQALARMGWNKVVSITSVGAG
ncbi:hypothetical protein [Pseudomonas sp. BW16M2]|nr:hypothetical protein [Pseudomonas sp. BW16M2]